MKSTLIETVALTHAQMVQAAETFPNGHKQHDGRGIKATLMMRAAEFRPYIRSARNFPAAFDMVVQGNVAMLVDMGKRQGRYVRALIESIGTGKVSGRYELEHVLLQLTHCGIGLDVKAMIETCPVKHTATDADINRVVDTLHTLGIITYKPQPGIRYYHFDWKNAAARCLYVNARERITGALR